MLNRELGSGRQVPFQREDEEELTSITAHVRKMGDCLDQRQYTIRAM
jgi:hypothetical protein